jgi:hypothetical protein
MKQVGGSSVALAPGHPKIPLKRNPPANPTAPIPIIVTVCRQSISDSWLGNLRECLAHLV